MALTIRTALASLALLIAVAATPASAAVREPAEDEPTIAQALTIADAWHGAHSCAGRTQVLVAPTHGTAAGEASGMHAVWVDGMWEWRIERCEIRVAPNLDPGRRCRAIVHEVGHLKYDVGRRFADGDDGWWHDGPMAPENLRPPACDGPPHPRRNLIDGIRIDLPIGIAWRITCTPNSARMRCRASSPAARHVRLYRASIVDGEFERVGRFRRH